MSARLYQFVWFPPLARRDGKRGKSGYVRVPCETKSAPRREARCRACGVEFLSYQALGAHRCKINRCGICGAECTSLLALSAHQCEITLQEAYDRAFGPAGAAGIAYDENGDVVYVCTCCKVAIVPHRGDVCEECRKKKEVPKERAV